MIVLAASTDSTASIGRSARSGANARPNSPPPFRARLRARLLRQPKEFLVDASIERIAPIEGIALTDSSDRAGARPDTSAAADTREGGVTRLDEVRLCEFIHRCRDFTRERLTITVARAKGPAIAGLLRAATEIDVEGTWRDPERVSHDDRAPNTLFEIEYGEIATEMVGRGIALALRLINDLEINEQILYARMENVEESSLECAS